MQPSCAPSVAITGCKVCDKQIMTLQSRSGPRPTTCDEHRHLRQRACQRCGGVHYGRGAYCSTECRTFTTECLHCGRSFEYVKSTGAARKFCSRTCNDRSQHAKQAAKQGIPVGVCSGCGDPTGNKAASRGHRERFCDDCRAENMRAQHRRKNYRRRHQRRPQQSGDVTATYERELRRKAKSCTMSDCNEQLTDVPNLPNSKELDHIVPLNIGGTHTIGNIRIICRKCNGARPKDGTDYAGQLSLWCQDEMVAASLARRPPKPLRLCACGQTLNKYGNCADCINAKKLRSIELGKKAAVMRASGMGWKEICRELGISNTGDAYFKATTYGDPDVIAAWPGRYKNARSAAVNLCAAA